MDRIKLDQAYLDSPCQDLSVRRPGIIIAHSICWQIIFCLRVLGVQFSSDLL